MKGHGPRGSRRRRIRSVWLSVLIILVVSVIALGGYAQYLLGSVGRNPDANLETISEEQLLGQQWIDKTPDEIVAPENISVRLGDGNTDVVNILLVGQDRRPGQKTVARSDAMILCTLNPGKKTITLTSFMRDMYISIPGKKDNRLNAAYAMGGTKLLNQCIEENFGITIHGNVSVDFQAFKDVIDMVGGVDVELTGEEAQYLNTVTYKDQETWARGFGAGTNHMDGNQALAYARIRKISGDDFGRTNRQRKVLSGLIEKLRMMGFAQATRTIKAFLGQVSTDMTNGQILGYAMDFIPYLNDYKVESQQIPANGTYCCSTIRGMQVLVPDLEKNRKVLEKIVS